MYVARNINSLSLGQVYENHANFTIGEYSFNAFWSQYLRASFPYHFTSYIFAIAKDRPYNSIEQFLFSFRDDVWFCTIGTLLLFLLVIAILKLIARKERMIVGKQNGSKLILNALSVYLGTSLHHFPTQNFTRTILSIWMIGCIVLRNSYQGSLLKLFRTPKRIPSPTTLDGLLDDNYRFVIRQSGIHLLQNNSKLDSL